MTSSQEQREPQAAASGETSRQAQEIEELRIALGRASVRIQKLETELEGARAQVAWFSQQVFGQKADRVSGDELATAWHAFLKEQEAKARGLPRLEERPVSTELSSIQLLLGFEGAAALEQYSSQGDGLNLADESVEAEAGAPAAPPKKKGHGRNRVPPTLREETIILEPTHVPEGAREVGSEVSYRVGIRRPELVRFAVVRRKYATDHDDETSTAIAIAEPPEEMIPRGVLAPSGLAHVIASKWDRHVPYNRLARSFAQSGYCLSTSTLSGAAIRAAPVAGILVEAMKTYAQSVAPYLAIDATGALLQQEEACLRGHVWLRYVENVCVLVSFTKTHDSESAGAQLDGWSCPTLADGAQVYDQKQRETRNPRGGCWSHARRKLVFAAPSDARALVGVKLINDLFDIERSLLDARPERRRAERARRSAQLVAELFGWRDELLARGNLGRSLLSKALRYLRNQAERLKYFLCDGNMPMHNNLAELQARHLALGRKNWLFFGSEAGAHAGAVWLSLVLSARMHGLDVEDYLRDLFRVLPSWPRSRVLELAPHAWLATRKRLDPLDLYRELGPLTIPPNLPS